MTEAYNIDERPSDVEPYRWFIGVTADGVYRFITPDSLRQAEAYIGEHGGGVYTHAGYLVFASNRSWWQWLIKDKPEGSNEPQIDVPNIECVFSEKALQWLKENEALLMEQGGKYYENLPRY